MTSLRLHAALAASLVAITAGCAANESIPDDDSCTDGKCDGTSSYVDPFKDLGDLESKTFEYIVVGSGAGGGPLAANLARQGHSVLLLEAGKDTGGKTEYQVPALHGTATETPDLAWWYFVEHYKDRARAAQDSKYTADGVLYPRGGHLGGSTAVNALITVAPKNSDWDAIAALTGDPTWQASHMQRYHDRVQRWLSIERPNVDAATLFDGSIAAILTGTFKVAADLGLGGPRVDESNPLANLFIMFEFLLRDINTQTIAGDARGVFQLPLATKNHRRNGTREYIVATVMDPRRFPLRVKTQALVTRVLWADTPDADGKPRATGVEFLDGAGLYDADIAGASTSAPKTVRVKATREVILAAGAFNTPQLLMLSGIGDRTELARHGIVTTVDLPGVGKNLQDRYEVGVISELSTEFSAVARCTFTADRNDPCYRAWQDRRGPYTSNGSVISVLAKSSPSLAEPDLHLFAVPGMFKGYYPGYSLDANRDRRHLTWVILKGHTNNRGGTVKLRSANPRERPLINFHYFDDGDVDQGQDASDLTAVVNGVELARRLAAKADAIDVFTTYRETWPGPGAASRADIAAWVKKEAWGHHASCSAPIGADGDPNAVLDSRFRVRGTSGLRVVDASVFPRIPGTFIVLPIYMISEKATDTLLAELGETRRESSFP
jgi:choline dehydrogenase